MYVRLYVNLRGGERCLIAKDGHPHQGRVAVFERLEYVGPYPLFVFSCEGERVALQSEFDFSVVPYAESVRFLLDLAFDLGDEAWAKELFELFLRRCSPE
ncbi:hypothetical protein [Paenibacillus sp.]|uniref:hypothetical protein n=1 Tax=Paenibacillus sp. TaxID=58172 RepID=UPI002D7476DE|nr:hypothetical protein [Paenibacillus sp.]HZG84215.1 hypothetical protein [Paenibacillus sp.]